MAILTDRSQCISLPADFACHDMLHTSSYVVLPARELDLQTSRNVRLRETAMGPDAPLKAHLALLPHSTAPSHPQPTTVVPPQPISNEIPQSLQSREDAAIPSHPCRFHRESTTIRKFFCYSITYLVSKRRRRRCFRAFGRDGIFRTADETVLFPDETIRRVRP